MRRPGLQIAVVGDARGDEILADRAEGVGRAIARAGAVLLCGGGGGVMTAAARGASEAGGLVVGILPGTDADGSPPNAHVELPIFTGMGQARNLVLVLSAAAVVAVGGGWGTLSEIALALKHGIPVVTLGSWKLDRPDGATEPRLIAASSPEDAVRRALEAARGGILEQRRETRE